MKSEKKMFVLLLLLLLLLLLSFKQKWRQIKTNKSSSKQIDLESKKGDEI